jgi:hypothetical protein
LDYENIYKINFIYLCIDRRYIYIKIEQFTDFDIYYFAKETEEYVNIKGKRESEIKKGTMNYDTIIIYYKLNVTLVSNNINNIIKELIKIDYKQASFIQLFCWKTKKEKVIQEFDKIQIKIDVFDKKYLKYDIPSHMLQPSVISIIKKKPDEMRNFMKMQIEDPFAKWFNLQTYHLLKATYIRLNGKIPYEEENIYQITKDQSVDEIEKNENIDEN